MPDIHSRQVRSKNMAAIRGKNTKPEIIVRRELHARGFRFRLHAKRLPGKPDLILPKYKLAIFVNGCFWHGHNCKYFKWPRTKESFWEQKICKNIERDHRNEEGLLLQGWRVCLIWECAIRKSRTDSNQPWLTELQAGILGDDCYFWIPAKQGQPGHHDPRLRSTPLTTPS
ncbi:very short patch repair endonuclease [Limimaricola variabilis]